MNDYQRIAAALEFLQDSAGRQPALTEAAQHIGLSPGHFQRLFQRFAGISPKRFLQHLTSRAAVTLLRESHSVLDTTFAVGLSSAGRLHDLMLSVEGVTPGTLGSGGAGLVISYGMYPTSFGPCLIGVTGRGVCRVEFFDTDPRPVLQRLEADWPEARLVEDSQAVAEVGTRLDALWGDGCRQPAQKSLGMLLKGTNFQLKVWRALLLIPPASVTSYGDLARRVGHPGAARAVGAAVGANPIAGLIPCHRVLRGDGSPGGYRWGTARKQIILGREIARAEAAQRPQPPAG